MVSQKNQISVLLLSSIIIALLSVQWMFVDVTFVFERGASVVQSALGPSAVSTVTAQDAALQFTPSPLDVLFALQLLFAMVFPAAWTFTQFSTVRVRRRSRLNKRLPGRNNPQSNLFVAPLRQWCASPDAHGP